MSNITFLDFLKTKRITQNPRGDFVMDATADPRFAKEVFETKQDLIDFLESRNACDEAIKEGRKLWNAYKKFIKNT